jgi:hypothetical protein
VSTIINIRGTNGSGKSSAVRALMAHLGKPTPFLFDNKEAGYRCKHFDQPIFVLGKYKTACGGLDASFSYKGAADDVLLCLDLLAEKGHVVCEGVIAMGSYGFGRLARFANDQKAKGNKVIFARLDTPADLCVQRVRARRKAAGNRKPFDPEKLLGKYASVVRSQEKLREAGYDARILPHEEPLQTMLRWFSERESTNHPSLAL